MSNAAERKKAICVVESQFFPCIGFFSLLKAFHNELYVEAHENYQKKSLRNRTILLQATQKLTLSVPLQKGKNKQTPIDQVRISYAENWPKKMLRSLRTCYGNTGFFDFYFADIERILLTPYSSLWALNLETIAYACQKLDLECPYSTSSYCTNVLYDYRDALFESSHPASHKINYPLYPQNTGNTDYFFPNLSILDLLFNMGPEAQWFLGTCEEIRH